MPSHGLGTGLFWLGLASHAARRGNGMGWEYRWTMGWALLTVPDVFLKHKSWEANGLNWPVAVFWRVSLCWSCKQAEDGKGVLPLPV